MNALVGKYFIGVYDDCMRSGIIEAAIGDTFYLVRFDTFIGFNDGSKWPEALAIVPVFAMVGVLVGADERIADDIPPPWLFFDNEEQRRTYDAWMDPPQADDRKPRIVSIRKDTGEKQ